MLIRPVSQPCFPLPTIKKNQLKAVACWKSAIGLIDLAIQVILELLECCSVLSLTDMLPVHEEVSPVIVHRERERADAPRGVSSVVSVAVAGHGVVAFLRTPEGAATTFWALKLHISRGHVDLLRFEFLADEYGQEA